LYITAILEKTNPQLITGGFFVWGLPTKKISHRFGKQGKQGRKNLMIIFAPKLNNLISGSPLAKWHISKLEGCYGI
jgi:hypothetical protein